MISTRVSFVMFSALLSHGGGRETWLNNMLPALLEARAFDAISVYYVTDKESDRYAKLPVCADPRIEWIELRLPVGGSKWRSLQRIVIFCLAAVKSLRAQPKAGHYVIAVGTFYEALVLYLLRRISLDHPQLVVWIRGIWLKEANHRYGVLLQYIVGAMERCWMDAADRLIANGDDTKAHYERWLGRHVEAIPNALDLTRFNNDTRPAFSGSSLPKVAYIGRLSEEKGLRSFLQAIEHTQAMEAHRSLVFYIVGDGPLRQLVEHFIASHPDWPVCYLGPMANAQIPAYLQSVDAGVCLTYSGDSGGGGVSNGLLELIGARRLVIAWNSTIYRQVLSDDQALFVSESDAVALAQAFVTITQDSADMRRRITRAADVLERYSLPRHVRHFIEFIHE